MEKEIFEQFLDLRKEKLLTVQEMKKGTDSKVFLVNEKYIFKFHGENVIKSEYEFFNSCKCDLNEKIVFVDDKFAYIVYEFIENDGKKFNAKELILKVKNYVDGYSDFAGDGFGFLFEETKSWKEFLLAEFEDKKKFALQVLSENDCEKVVEAIDLIAEYSFTKKLMHGDFGLHNLLFKNGEFVGVIDPQPLIGDPLYDFVFCILSDEDIAKSEIVSSIYEYVPNEPKEKVDAMILFVLFGRIARCVKYHLAELDGFLLFWNDVCKLI